MSELEALLRKEGKQGDYIKDTGGRPIYWWDVASKKWVPMISNNTIEHPNHYNLHPSGVECITIAEHFNFNLGNAIKYIWRAGLKSKDPIEDLKKARFYLDREISNLENTKK